MKEYTTNISTRITISKLTKIDKIADEKNITRNEVVNIAIDEYLKGVK